MSCVIIINCKWIVWKSFFCVDFPPYIVYINQATFFSHALNPTSAALLAPHLGLPEAMDPAPSFCHPSLYHLLVLAAVESAGPGISVLLLSVQGLVTRVPPTLWQMLSPGIVREDVSSTCEDWWMVGFVRGAVRESGFQTLLLPLSCVLFIIYMSLCFPNKVLWGISLKNE